MARSGTAIALALLPLTGDALQAEILKIARAGDVPDAIKNQFWRWVTVQAKDTKGVLHTLRYLVMPDFYALGTNEDPLRPMLYPWTLQSLADDYKSIMLTKRMSRQVHDAADVKLPYQGVTGPPYYVKDISSTEAMIQRNRMVQAALGGKSMADHLIAGEMKDVVMGPDLDGTHVAIYGGQGGAVDGWAIQAYNSTGHFDKYTDYSQGGRLAFRRAFLDDQEVDLVDILQHPVLHVLLSDQGPFYPRYPSVGALRTAIPALVKPPVKLGLVEGSGGGFLPYPSTLPPISGELVLVGNGTEARKSAPQNGNLIVGLTATVVGIAIVGSILNRP